MAVRNLIKRLVNPGASQSAAAEWWRGAVIYQIYPRSFLDANGDGVGDLHGVIEKLDYIADLGVEGIWLCPFFTSPMDDFGYDVADYRDVDPLFGDLETFDRLVEKAHKLGLKVIIDQVYSHTSDQHAWFAESRADRDNAKADWYVWADPKPDGSPPNNWLSVFGGSAWAWDSRRRQYYLHNFLASQPDLNLHNRAVQDALIDVARFWLDRGVDGFRLDAINFAMHDPELRDNPPTPQGETLPLKPYHYQQHIHNKSHTDVSGFLERLRQSINTHGEIFTVAEIGGDDPLPEMKAFTANDTRLNSAYSFDFLYADRLTPSLLKQALAAWPGEEGEGWPSWTFSNHDAPRAVSRWAPEPERGRAAKLYGLLLLCLRGNIFLYQGEELGLPQAEIDFADLKDPEAIANWPVTLGRDGARTPMPWRADGPHAGFSTAAPWLPVTEAHERLSVEQQESDPASVLHFMKEALSLRRTSPALRQGEMQFLDAAPSVTAFIRRTEDEEMLCVFNLAGETVRWRAPEQDQYALALSTFDTEEGAAPPDALPGFAGYTARRRP